VAVLQAVVIGLYSLEDRLPAIKAEILQRRGAGPAQP
jgi:hypothetical protein